MHAVIASEDSVKGLVDSKEARVLLVFNDVRRYPGAITVKEVGFPALAEQLSSHCFIIAPPALEKEPQNILIAALKKRPPIQNFWAGPRKTRYP